MSVRRGPRVAVITNCVECKKEISVTPKRLAAGRGQYCSVECKKKHKQYQFTCIRCGKDCVDYISRSGRKVYCSKDCQIQHLFIENKKEGLDHYNFQGFKHSNTLRKMAFVLHGKECSKCGGTSDLHVHHVDHDHGNNPFDGSNWMILCSTCHMNYHGIVKSLVAENNLIACPNCDQEFHPRHSKTKFCSRSCSATYHHKIKREAHL